MGGFGGWKWRDISSFTILVRIGIFQRARLRNSEMSKSPFEPSKRRTTNSIGRSNGNTRRSPLAELVNTHLRANNMRQVDFCRETAFDQGLLSKILSSVVSTLNIESALKLAEGMNVPPSVVFDAIGKQHVEEMLRKFYCHSDKVM